MYLMRVQNFVLCGQPAEISPKHKINVNIVLASVLWAGKNYRHRIKRVRNDVMRASSTTTARIQLQNPGILIFASSTHTVNIKLGLCQPIGMPTDVISTST